MNKFTTTFAALSLVFLSHSASADPVADLSNRVAEQLSHRVATISADYYQSIEATIVEQVAEAVNLAEESTDQPAVVAKVKTEQADNGQKL